MVRGSLRKKRQRRQGVGVRAPRDSRRRQREPLFFFMQKTAYEIRPCDWSSDVCSSDLYGDHNEGLTAIRTPASSGGAALEEPTSLPLRRDGLEQIGRASCRERVYGL